MHDSIFARAKRGDLPQALSIAEICRLATASLQAPHGQYAPGDALAVALRRLVALELIAPERTETVTLAARPLGSFGGQVIATGGGPSLEHFIRAADLRPHLGDLGEVGPLLTDWAMQGVAAPKSESTGEHWYAQRLLNFCEVLVASGEVASDKPGFTLGDLSKAVGELGLWHRPGEPLPTAEALRGYAAEIGSKYFTFNNGRPAGGQPAELRQMQAVRRLVAIYQRHVEQNVEPGNRAAPVSASNFLHRAAG